MNLSEEKIRVRAESGSCLDVVVLSRHADAIWVVIGEGMHNVKCKLTPTRNNLAYAGSVMGREIVYERSVKEVKDDIARANRVPDRLRPR